MTPADHYAEADRLLADAKVRLADGLGANSLLAVAQVHATLATVDPNRVWPRQWIVSKTDPEALFAGVVTRAGEGRVLVEVAVDPGRYPEVGQHVTIFGNVTPPLQPKGSTGEVRMEGGD